MKRLRVLIADDNELMRRAIVQLLDSAFCVVADVVDGVELVHVAMQLRPDVIVSDICMPRMGGLAARKQLIALGLNIPFVFVSGLGLEVVSILPKERFVAFVYKLDIPSHLCHAVETVLTGRTYLSPSCRDGKPPRGDSN